MTEQQTLTETTAPETAPAPQGVPVGGAVWLCIVEHEHGTNVDAYTSQDAAKDNLVAYVDRWWSQEMPEERPADDDEAIRAYFEDNEKQSYEIVGARLHR